MAFENLFGSAPPVFGSNLLFTSAINSQPLLKNTKKKKRRRRERLYSELKNNQEKAIQKLKRSTVNKLWLKNSVGFLEVTWKVSAHQ